MSRVSHPPAPPATSSPVPDPRTSSSASGTRAEPAIDTRKGHDDYDTLMADVRAYCLAEYKRILGRPWDDTWPEELRHIQKMRDVASRAHEVWSQLQRATKAAIDFVASQGLPHHEEADLLGTAGKTVYESVVIHGWLYRHFEAVEDLLCTEELEKMPSARSMLATILGRTRIEDPAQSAAPIIWNSGRLRERELKEREMAYISLLVGNEPSKLKDRLKNELLSVEDVIAMEREAINTTRQRHDEGKIETRAMRAASSASKTTRKTPKKWKAAALQISSFVGGGRRGTCEHVPTLVLSLRYSPDSNALFAAALAAGWDVERLHSFRCPEGLAARDPVFYGETIVADAILDDLGVALLEPTADWLPRLPQRHRRREVRLATLGDALALRDRAFIKPTDEKLFPARVYADGAALDPDPSLPLDLPVLVSEPVVFEVEFRFFVVEREVAALSPYVRGGEIARGAAGDWEADRAEVEAASASICSPTPTWSYRPRWSWTSDEWRGEAGVWSRRIPHGPRGSAGATRPTCCACSGVLPCRGARCRRPINAGYGASDDGSGSCPCRTTSSPT